MHDEQLTKISHGRSLRDTLPQHLPYGLNTQGHDRGGSGCSFIAVSAINHRGHRNRMIAPRCQGDVPSPSVLYEYARRMRRNPTPAENVLWQMLRANGLGVRFRRQEVIQQYIVDFRCRPADLIIEVDGGVHDAPEAQLADADRTDLLQSLGFTVLRFRNEEVLQNLPSVRTQIIEALRYDDAI